MPFLTPPAEPEAPTQARDDEQPSVDGRRARRDRNADTVVNALLELFREGEMYPSAQQVADRSGVSLRSVFRYFSDLNQLAIHAFATQVARTAHLWVLEEPAPGTPLAERISALAAHRARLYEVIAPFARAAMVRAPRLPFVAAFLEQRRAAGRDHLRASFAPELERLPAARRAVELDCLDAATTFEACDHLVYRTGRSIAALEAMLTLTLTRLLAPIA